MTLCGLLLATSIILPGFTQPGKLVSYDFNNADIAQVIRVLAGEAGVKVSISSSLRGKVTLKLENAEAAVALQKALNLLPEGYGYKRIDDTLMVDTHQRLAQMKPKPQVYNAPIVAGVEQPEAAPAPAPPRRPGYVGKVSNRGPARRGRVAGDFNTESYDRITEGGYQKVSDQPLSTFSIDVDTAAYSNVRRFLMEGRLPPKDAVRIEEMLNYFRYSYPKPEKGEPFSVSTELADCPWAPEHQILQVGLSAPAIESQDVPPRNLVFLLDVSGSMNSPDKLPLLKSAAKLLTSTLRDEDHVSIVVYAGASGTVLPPTSGAEQEKILAALEALSAGGSTNGGAGIELAYKLAQENFRQDAINRVILATDGDFNVGVSSRGALIELIEAKRKSGIFLTVLGFGSGILKDSSMEQLADKGNGNYAYIDSLMEARKVLVEEAGATLVTVAKDVKLQVEFNPLKVSSYRLIGYENRKLNNEDFQDDTKDAGEMGAGHTVTALYEIVPGKSDASDLRYQADRNPTAQARSAELALVKVRFKKPDGDKSALREFVVKDAARPFAQSSKNLQFAASVASVGMLLRDSEHKGASDFDKALSWARRSLDEDRGGYRHEFVRLVELAKDLKPAGS